VAVAATVSGPSLVSGPAVSGTAAQSRQLTASPGTWSGLGPVTFAYQWYRCDVTGSACAVIRGATGQTYTLGSRDVGKTLGLTLRATDTSGTATAYAPRRPDHTDAGSTDRHRAAGDRRDTPRQSLVVSPGAVADAASVSYAWQRCSERPHLHPDRRRERLRCAVTSLDSGTRSRPS
jgi:hypothetical protein